ncbi:MAG: CDP-alcohol phosphatidyltransferase family protein, partial [Pseudomonadota bacterium]
AGVMLAFLLGSPMDIKPLFVSKANTAIQIFLISVVMGALAFTLQIDGLVVVLVYCTGALTVLSAFAYLQQWTRHVAEG